MQTVFASSGQTQANFRRKGKLPNKKLDKDRSESDLNQDLRKLELCCEMKRKQIFVEKYVADRNPVMTSNRFQIAVKRLACCKILGSGFSSGIKVSFENIVSEILSDYTLI